ncbi:hypothetical protein OF001_U30025 [Pseudomonas sp. OF001]|nr:hypothetical protein OF001_U30025 [Pseudomonas sp. OF001]
MPLSHPRCGRKVLETTAGAISCAWHQRTSNHTVMYSRLLSGQRRYWPQAISPSHTDQPRSNSYASANCYPKARVLTILTAMRIDRSWPIAAASHSPPRTFTTSPDHHLSNHSREPQTGPRIYAPMVGNASGSFPPYRLRGDLRLHRG